MDGYKAVIFDFDGTLYDFSHLPVRLALSMPLELRALKADRTVRREMRGTDAGSREAFRAEYGRQMAGLLRCTQEEALSWSGRYMARMVTVLERHYRARDGLDGLLRAAHDSGLRLAVLSDYPLVRERMLAVGMEEETIGLFSVIASAEDYGCLKPAVRPFRSIASLLETDAGHCLVVGDRDDTDGEGARRSGMGFMQILAEGTQTWNDFAAWLQKHITQGGSV